MNNAMTTPDAMREARRAVWLRREGDHTVVLIEKNGVWTEIIRERFDGAFSHIWEDAR